MGLSLHESVSLRRVSTTEAPSFSPQLFAFLRELKKHNEREWFNANKPRYEEEIKEPALAFIEDVGYRLPEVAPQLTADKRSMFRIYRDTRFAKDKSPYKTHVGIYFRHEASADADTAGLYLHLEPGHVFLGAGSGTRGRRRSSGCATRSSPTRTRGARPSRRSRRPGGRARASG
jgi:uncharacterized protein (DUF2461 family)